MHDIKASVIRRRRMKNSYVNEIPNNKAPEDDLTDEFSVRDGAHFFSSASQLVNRVMEVDLVWSTVRTTKRWPSALTS